MNIQLKLVVVDSNPTFKKIIIGNKLDIKAYLTEDLTKFGQFSFFRKRGIVNNVKVRMKEELNNKFRSITFTWGCTKNFWYLKPMDNYYPLKVE